MTDLLATILTSPLVLSLALIVLVGATIVALWLADEADRRRFHAMYDANAFNHPLAAPRGERPASGLPLKGGPR